MIKQTIGAIKPRVNLNDMDFFANQLPSKFRPLPKNPAYYLHLPTQLLGFPLHNIVPSAGHNVVKGVCKIGQNIVGMRSQLDINQSGGYLSTQFTGKIERG